MRDLRDKQHTRNECWIGQTLIRRGEAIPVGLLRCDGPWDLHHVLRKSRIRKELASEDVEAAVLDARNLVLGCRRHHDLVTRELVQIARAELPAEFFAFLADYRLEGWGHRYYPEGRAA